jgi:hypothetical protein
MGSLTAGASCFWQEKRVAASTARENFFHDFLFVFF